MGKDTTAEVAKILLSEAEHNDVIQEADPHPLTADGLDDAFLGFTAYSPGRQPLAVYSIERCIQCFVDQGMDRDEAEEFFSFNTVGAWMGDGTPLFIDDTDFETYGHKLGWTEDDMSWWERFKAACRRLVTRLSGRRGGSVEDGE